ncbi:cyanate transporter [Chromobacterium paludis]|uniref:CynX/NimT family MFS transporter n=1 Tax=Chromobacterium paludis TaxID=2605945 RepID=A0A5C1DNA5_9NEIS|nr:cyanate transporter [Chromobacterium paludis]QEL57479.1 CynX/NimT family MFS transporter [Chromobacterium paludis]
MPSKPSRSSLGLSCAIILVGLNLRPGLAAIGPLLEPIRQATGIRFSDAALLTTLPIAAMGAGAFAGSRLEAWLGARRGVLLALLLILLSCALRLSPPGYPSLLATAVLAGCGIALAQALLPGLIKRHFPERVSLLMGLYVTAIMGGASLAAAGAPWLAQASGQWHWGLAVWALPAALACALWWRHAPDASHQTGAAAQNDGFARLPRAWLLAVFFGLGTAVYTCSLAWLPPFFVSQGWSGQQGGLMLSYMTGMEVLAGLTLPALSARSADLRGWLALTLLATLAGLLGMVALPGGAMLLWVGLLGLGVGGLFPLSMILTLSHLDDGHAAGRLTAFVQGVGYLIAACAPFFAGWLRDLTSSFQLAWLALAAAVALLLLAAWRFSPQGYRQAMRLA